MGAPYRYGAGVALSDRPSSAPASRFAVSRPVAIALSLGGLAWFLVQVWILRERWAIPGGDVMIFLNAGVDLRNGVTPYDYGTVPLPWLYGPPWVVLFAAISLIPPEGGYFVVFAAQVAALRYMARSWRGVGYLLWLPIMPFELIGGAVNLIVAAAIVAAVRGQPWIALMGTLAKLGPLLAADPRDWRRYVVPALVLGAITLPWPWLWGAWFETLTSAVRGAPIGPQIPVPLLVRLPIAAALILYGRPWSRALGAVVGMPAFYYQSFVLLAAPVAVWLFQHNDDQPNRGRLFSRKRQASVAAV